MTKQTSEQIDFCGETYLTDRYPLEQCAAVLDVLAAYRNRNTGCRRGYVGHWCIKNDRLLLCDAVTAIDLGLGNSLLSQLSGLILPRKDGRLVAGWYSGEIGLRADQPRPNLLNDPTYVKHRLFIEAGKVIRIEHFQAPDRSAAPPDVRYDHLPRFLKQLFE